MFIDLHKALERVEENLPKDRRITFEMLEKAYEQTLWLRSHILGVMYDMIDFGSASKRTIGEVSVSQTDSNQMVCLVMASWIIRVQCSSSVPVSSFSPGSGSGITRQTI